MPQTQYNLHLKGFVGGADFDRNYVDYILAKNAGKEVNVLIDSLVHARCRPEVEVYRHTSRQVATHFGGAG